MTANRPTMPGVNSRAVGRFHHTGRRGYAAVYTDGTLGPIRPSREQAEIDFHAANDASPERRALIERYGARSLVFRPWELIHADHRTEEADGTRQVLTMDPWTGAIAQAAWIGPLDTNTHNDTKEA